LHWSQFPVQSAADASQLNEVALSWEQTSQFPVHAAAFASQL
jgi:hypothetical protein